MFPEISEADASGETAALYADLRAVTGVPLVNLIWRHLATLPGMLSWTWGVVRPLHVSGLLAEARRELLHDLPAPPGLRQPDCVFDVAGVGPQHRATIAALIAQYELGNGGNLLALTAALSLLRGAQAGGGTLPAASAPPAAAQVELPPLPALAALPPAVLALVLSLDQLGRSAPSNAVASLYRHLAHWPGFLVIAHAALAGEQQNAAALAAIAAGRARAETIAATRLLPLLALPPAPDPAGAPPAIEALMQFTTGMIPRMVIMGRALAILLPL